jgi:hypothetical protein
MKMQFSAASMITGLVSALGGKSMYPQPNTVLWAWDPIIRKWDDFRSG